MRPRATLGSILFGALWITLSWPEVVNSLQNTLGNLGMIGPEWHWWNYLGVSIGALILLWAIYPKLKKPLPTLASVIGRIKAWWDRLPEPLKEILEDAWEPFDFTFYIVVRMLPIVLFISLLVWGIGHLAKWWG